MRIVRGGMGAFTLPLLRPLETAHGPIASRQGFLVTLEDEAGRRGFGEATPLPDFGTESLSRCRAALATALESLVDASTMELADRWQAALAACAEAPCARSAIDGALHDLASREAECALSDWVRRSAGLHGPAQREICVQALPRLHPLTTCSLPTSSCPALLEFPGRAV